MSMSPKLSSPFRSSLNTLFSNAHPIPSNTSELYFNSEPSKLWEKNTAPVIQFLKPQTKLQWLFDTVLLDHIVT
jgi:hypothetical protein